MGDRRLAESVGTSLKGLEVTSLTRPLGKFASATPDLTPPIPLDLTSKLSDVEPLDQVLTSVFHEGPDSKIFSCTADYGLVLSYSVSLQW